MSELTDLKGCELVEALGKAWTVRHLGPGIRAKFSAWCKLRARQEIIAQREGLGQDDYREQVSILNEARGAGDYNWNTPLGGGESMGPGVRAAFRQQDGQVRLLALLLEKDHGTIPEDRVLALLADNGEGFGDAIRAAMGLPPNPKAPAPVEEEGAPGEERLTTG